MTDLKKMADELRATCVELNGTKAMALTSMFREITTSMLDATPTDVQLSSALTAAAGAVAFQSAIKENADAVRRVLSDGTNRSDMERAASICEAVAALLRASLEKVK